MRRGAEAPLQKVWREPCVSLTEALVKTEAHVFNPFLVVEARNVVRCIVEPKQFLGTL